MTCHKDDPGAACLCDRCRESLVVARLKKKREEALAFLPVQVAVAVSIADFYELTHSELTELLDQRLAVARLQLLNEVLALRSLREKTLKGGG